MTYGTYLTRSRHQTNWYARIVIPIDVRQHFRQRREFRKSLSTSCKTIAKRRAAAIWLAYQEVFDALRNGLPVKEINPEWGALAFMPHALQPHTDERSNVNGEQYRFLSLEPIVGYRESDGGSVVIEYVTFHPVTGMPIIEGETPENTIRIAKELMAHHRELFGNKAQASIPLEEKLNPVGKMLSELFETFLTERQRDSSDDTKSAHRYAFDVFVELMGDMAVKELTKKVAREFADEYRDYPVQRRKGSWAKVSLDDLMAIGRPRISATTFNNNIRKLTTFGQWLVTIDELSKNPFTAITKASESDANKTRSWSDEELRRWFQSNEYLQHRYGTATVARYWLPLLALYSGARLEELASLTPGDISTFKGVLAYRIHGEDGRRLKNSNAWRYVPIHSHLVRLGFMEYVKGRKGKERLFPLTCYRGKWSKYVSKRLGEMRQHLKIEPNFHGYRNTVITRLFEHAEQAHHVPLITGQEVSGEAWQYLMKSDKSVLLPKLSELVEKLDWSHVIDIPT